MKIKIGKYVGDEQPFYSIAEIDLILITQLRKLLN